jgi:hypothetical protein
MRERSNMLGTIDVHDPDTYMTNPYPKGLSKVAIPEGKSGKWSVTKFNVEVSNVSMFNLRLIRDGYPQRVVPPGEYTRLCCGNIVVMSDTPAEAHEHYAALRDAKGDVLINGLGLGFFLSAVLKKDEVDHVTVIEKSRDVIRLVGPSFKGSKARIICADALEWRPKSGVRYGFVWHDIWNEISDDNKEEMTKLKRSYARRCDRQACWSQPYL